MKAVIFKFIIPLLIVAGGVAGLIILKGKAEKAKHVDVEQRVINVETQVAKVDSLPMKIVASGSVRPAKQIVLTPEVSGRIIYVSENLIPGSRFAAGELMVKIDKRDYKLALEQQVGQVEQARLNLTLEHSRGHIAQKEWSMIAGNSSGDDSAGLALRKPQLQEAKQRQNSANSGLARAKLNLKKTAIKAPFDAVVIDKNVDLGQVVGPSSVLVSLMGTKQLWVDVSVPVEHIGSIQIPGVNSTQGSGATIIQKIGNGKRILREGKVIRLHGQLDNRNRTATVLVSVDNPFDVGAKELPLLSGAYVEVEIHGDIHQDVVRIPRGAFREGHYVWIVTPKAKLHKREVEVGWKEQENVVISSGLSSGDEIVVSPISFPLEGMPVNRVGTDAHPNKKAEK